MNTFEPPTPPIPPVPPPGQPTAILPQVAPTGYVIPPSIGALFSRSFEILGRAWWRMGAWILVAVAIGTVLPMVINEVAAPVVFGDASSHFQEFEKSIDTAELQAEFSEENVDPADLNQFPFEAIDFAALNEGIDELNLVSGVVSLLAVGALIVLATMIINGLLGVRAAREGLGEHAPPITTQRTIRAVGAQVLSQSIVGLLMIAPLAIFMLGAAAAVSSSADEAAEVLQVLVTDLDQLSPEQWQALDQNLEANSGSSYDSVAAENTVLEGAFDDTELAWNARSDTFAKAIPGLIVSSLVLLIWPITGIIGIWLWICWSLVLPVVAAEGLPARRAMKRSAWLVKGRWWSLALIFLVIMIGLAITGAVIGVIMGGVILQFVASLVGALLFMSVTVAAYQLLRQWKIDDPVWSSTSPFEGVNDGHTSSTATGSPFRSDN